MQKCRAFFPNLNDDNKLTICNLIQEIHEGLQKCKIVQDALPTPFQKTSAKNDDALLTRNVGFIHMERAYPILDIQNFTVKKLVDASALDLAPLEHMKK